MAHSNGLGETGEDGLQVQNTYFVTRGLSSHPLYVALSCVGARVKTWRQMLNFIDCPKFQHDVREIPLMGGDSSDRIYRYFPKNTGCWKRYDTPPISYSGVKFS